LPVDDAVIVEIIAVESLAPIHETQLLSYLRLADCKVSLLIDLNVKSLNHGIKRLANQTS
jgi:GxxExxY protein